MSSVMHLKMAVPGCLEEIREDDAVLAPALETSSTFGTPEGDWKGLLMIMNFLARKIVENLLPQYIFLRAHII